MFTLDDITLFFWNDSNDARSKRQGETKDKFVTTWVGTTHWRGVTSTSGSQLSHALVCHLEASNVSSCSVPSSQVVVRATAGKHQLSDDNTYASEVSRGAVSDNDKLEGAECEESCNSPLKGKRQANNNICSVLSLLCR